MPELLVKEKESEKIFRVKQRSLTVGRSPENDLVFDDPSISGKHCVFRTDDDNVKIVDLNSSNGTVVNGERIKGSSPLKDGDVVAVGNLEITFFAKAAPVSRIDIKGPDMDGITIALGKETLAIGRLPENNVVFPHERVSGFHAQIIPEGAGYRLKDLGSSNGTKVNGESGTSWVLKNGDRIVIYPYNLTFHGVPGSAAAGRPESDDAFIVKSISHKSLMRAVLPAAALVGICILLVLLEAVAHRLAAPPVNPAVSGINLLLENASFEKDAGGARIPPSWHVEGDVRSIAKLTKAGARTGTSCLQIETKPGGTAYSAVVCTYKKGIPVGAGRAYRGILWVKALQRNGFCAAGLQWLDSGGQIIGESTGSVVVDAGDWTPVVVTGVPPEKAHRVKLQLLAYGGEGILRVDDACMYELPMEEAGTVRYEALLGDGKFIMDRRGVFSLSSGDTLIVRRGELTADVGESEIKQSLGAVARDYPVMNINGFTTRGRLCDLSSGRWMRFESEIKPRDGSMHFAYRILSEEGAKPDSIHLDLFVSKDVLTENGMRTVGSAGEAVHQTSFTERNIDEVAWVISGKMVVLDTGSFNTVTLKDAGNRGLRLRLSGSYETEIGFVITLE